MNETEIRKIYKKLSNLENTRLSNITKERFDKYANDFSDIMPVHILQKPIIE